MMKESHNPFEGVSNFYEQQVYDHVVKMLANEFADEPKFLADVACVALNSLPPKYIRHHVDMVFYMTSDERAHMENSITQAISDAIDFVRSHRRNQREST